MRCGYRRYRALADGGRGDGQKLARAWGGTQAKTHVVEAPLGAWAARVLAALPPAPGELDARASAGTTRRGSRTPGAPAAQLRSALRHRLGWPLGPQAVADKTAELPLQEGVLQGLGAEGRVSTAEALLTQRTLAHRIAARGGDAVRPVKGNHARLQRALPLVCHAPSAVAAARAAVATVDRGHGRLAGRRLAASPALAGARDGPGLAQGVSLERHVTSKQRGEQHYAVVSGITRLGPDRAAPARLPPGVRGPWQLGTTGPGVRQGPFDEDRSHGRGAVVPTRGPRSATPPSACGPGQASPRSRQPAAVVRRRRGAREI